jgi:DNA mismatch endonuclease, patch repair protein
MAAIRRRDTRIEKQLRSWLHAEGLRFRVDHPLRLDQGRPIRPDIVFTRAKVAVFVDGCYWHGCPTHGRRRAGVNTAYWGPKIARNIERDRLHDAALEKAGWKVLRIWEHVPIETAVAQVKQAIAGRRARLTPV